VRVCACVRVCVRVCVCVFGGGKMKARQSGVIQVGAIPI
jgi:hypothetical protein